MGDRSDHMSSTPRRIPVHAQRSALGNLDLFRETRACIVDVEDLHLDSPKKKRLKSDGISNCPRRSSWVAPPSCLWTTEAGNSQAATIWQAGVGGWNGMFSWEKRA
jgi:hypothetical protein